MANYRDSYWRWLTLGLKGLVTLIEEQAKEQTPGPEEMQQLKSNAARLNAVVGRFASGPIKTGD